MSYPQYPQQVGYPAYPTGAAGAQSVSGGTAIAAGVLACLGAVWSLISLLILLFGFGLIGSAPTGFVVVFFVGLIANLALTGLLGAGGVMMFMKKPIAKWLVVGGCGVAIGTQLLGLIVGLAMSAGSGFGGGPVVGSIGLQIALMIPAIVTLVLALLPMTGQWLAQGKQPAAAQVYATPGGYPQQTPQSGGYPRQAPQSGGYPQQGQPPRQW